MHAQIFLSIVPGEVLQHTPSKYNLRSCHSVQALGVTMSVHISLSGNCLNGFALQKLTRSSWLFRLGGGWGQSEGGRVLTAWWPQAQR